MQHPKNRIPKKNLTHECTAPKPIIPSTFLHPIALSQKKPQLKQPTNNQSKANQTKQNKTHQHPHPHTYTHKHTCIHALETRHRQNHGHLHEAPASKNDGAGTDTGKKNATNEQE